MTHPATSRILEDMIIEFRKKGLLIPQNVLTDLKSARTLMKMENADQISRGETESKIDEYLSTVEAYLITEAQKILPPEQVDEWLRRLVAAGGDSCPILAKEEKRFVHGIPRDQKWIRIEPLENMPLDKLEELATGTNLSFRQEDDGHLTVFGGAEDIKKFVKKMTEKAQE
jgi:hypothetical protein